MYTFKVMGFNDIPMVVDWLKKPHIKEYWYSVINYTEEMITEKYIKRIKEGIIHMYVIHLNDVPIGLIQTYVIEDTQQFKTEDNCMGIDLFIGEEDALGKGNAANLIHCFIKQYVFIKKDVGVVCIDPEVRNKRAIHVYEKVGFQHVNTEIDVKSKLLTYYMVLKKKDFFDLL